MWKYGEIAYSAYLNHWIEAGMPRGIPWPEWEELPLEEKEAWTAAAVAARKA